MPKDNDAEGLKVFVRVRPPISTEVKLGNAVTASGGCNINVSSDKTQVKCSYDRVFDENCQQSDVFNSVKPLLDDVLKGINGTVFAYGQTSAGKSHSMLGPDGGVNLLKTSKHHWGLLPRAADYLISKLVQLEKDGELTFKIKASYLQIYNETVYDLLRDTNVEHTHNISAASPAKGGGTGGNAAASKAKDKDKEEIDLEASEKPAKSSLFRSDERGLKIREVARAAREEPAAYGAMAAPQEVYVSGLSEYRVNSLSDILALLNAGTSNRTMRSTDFNATSSRSHAILQLSFETEHCGNTGNTTISTSKLSLADLAGSEKILTDETNPVGVDSKENSFVKTKHLRELTSINTSLSCLGNVIAALTNKNRTHIPYRDSKLTRLLQDSLGGNTRTILLACIAPTEMHTSETVNTLQFADRAKGVMLKVRANTLVDDKAALSRANAEISRLQNLLANALAKLEGKLGASPMKETNTLSSESPIRGGGSGVANANYINGEGSSIEYFIQENARLREENFELRATMEHQSSLADRKRQAKSVKADKAANILQPQQEVSNNFHGNNSNSQASALDGDDSTRTKEQDLHRVNRKQRRRQNRKQLNELRHEREADHSQTRSGDVSNIVQRFKQASHLESQALSASGNFGNKINAPKIYGASSSLKVLTKARKSFHEDDKELGTTNPEYFSGFLSSAVLDNTEESFRAAVQAHQSGQQASQAKREKNLLAQAGVNPYTGEPLNKVKVTGSNSARKGSGKKRNGGDNGPNQSSTSPARMRLEKERSTLEKEFESTKAELLNEAGVLDGLTAQRMSLERQLMEIALNKSLDTTASAATYTAKKALKAKDFNGIPPPIEIDSPRGENSRTDLNLLNSDEGYPSADFHPLSLGSTLHGYGGNGNAFVQDNAEHENVSPLSGGESFNSDSKEEDNKENHGNRADRLSDVSLPTLPPTRSIGEILTPKRGGAGGAHAAHLRENIFQASVAQALPSPTKNMTQNQDPSGGQGATITPLGHVEPIPAAGLSARASGSASVSTHANTKSNTESNINHTAQTEANPRKPVQHSAEDGSGALQYSHADVGRIVQLFMFRHSSWQDMRIDNYDPNCGMHLLTSVGDGRSQLQDLRKKPVRFPGSSSSSSS